MVARPQILSGTQRGCLQVVGHLVGPENRQIVFGLCSSDARCGLKPIMEGHCDPLYPRDDMQVGQNDAFVDDHHAGAHAALNVVFAIFSAGEPRDPHHRGSNGLNSTSRRRWGHRVLKGAHYSLIDVLLGDGAGRRRLPQPCACDQKDRQ